MTVIEARAFAGTLEAAIEAEAWAADHAKRLDLSEQATFAMTLCLEELFVNAVTHGAAREVRVALTDETLEFRDNGVAFDPSWAPQKRLQGQTFDFEIGGFGTGLLREFADRLSYRREGDWNVVRLAFHARSR
jgi:anti-sigma regulatory factor (Ser/Thr protein kinase)